MSISDESFPEDDFNDIPISEQNNFKFEDNSSNFDGHSPSSITEQSSSGRISQDAMVHGEHFIFSNILETKPKRKSNSWQDLHSEYSQKRYQHVKSKVKQYIAEIKAQDRRKTIGRHRSLPETIGNYTCEQNTSSSTATVLNNNELAGKLLEKDQEVIELTKLNESLHRNLQEKTALVSRLRRNTDIMRFELLKYKDKHQKTTTTSSAIGILRNVCTPRRSPFSQKRVSSAISLGTQTDDTRKTPKPIHTPYTPLHYRKHNEDVKNFVNKTNSDIDNNSLTLSATESEDEEVYDSAIETTSTDNSCNHKNEKEIDTDHEFEWSEQRASLRTSTKSKFRKRFKKYFLKSYKILPSCCVKRSNLRGEYAYSPITLSDTSIHPPSPISSFYTYPNHIHGII